MAQLNECLKSILNEFEVFKKDNILSVDESKENRELLVSFLSAKQIEGCSEKTIDYYRNTISRMLRSVNLKIESITTEDLRKYLADYVNQEGEGFGNAFRTGIRFAQIRNFLSWTLTGHTIRNIFRTYIISS